MPPPAPLSRPSARVLILDESDRLLLLSSRDESTGTTRWKAVGGGVRPGESHEQAALRELREETGLTGVALGPEVWRGRPWSATRDGVTYEVRQRYFVLRVPWFEVDTSGFEEFEREASPGTDGGRSTSWPPPTTCCGLPGCRSCWPGCWQQGLPLSRSSWTVDLGSEG